jgi:hypothetical protein
MIWQDNLMVKDDLEDIGSDGDNITNYLKEVVYDCGTDTCGSG